MYNFIYMQNFSYSKILKNNWEIVALIIGVTIVLSLVFSILQPFKYQAATQILIIQKQVPNLDAYTATKSAEKIGKNLASIIYTSSFYNNVIESNVNIKNRFPQNDIERRKAWKEDIEARVIPETGILEISVYDEDKNYAAQLVRTISYVLVNKGAEYHGGGEGVEIKIVDDVLLSKYPVKPNIILNAALAVVLGLVLGCAFVILRESRRAVLPETQQVNLFDLAPAEDKQYEILREEEMDIESDKEKSLKPVEVKEINLELESKPAKELSPLMTEIKTMYDHLENK